MAVSYNYSLYQKEALESESKANIARLILVSFLFFVLFCSIILWKRYKDIRKRKQEEIENLKAQHIRAAYEYSRNIYTMQLIDKTRKQDIELMKKDNDEYENKMTELIEENKRLEETIKHVEQQKGIAQYLHNTTEFMKTDIVKYLKDLELKPLSAIKEEDWVNLDTEVSKYFPNLVLDLHNSPKVTKQKKQVCLLVIIKISDSCIANWLNLKPNRISNIKSELNEMLFGESSARTLYTKLSQKYNIIVSGE
jgi:ABC-type multidrug transport system fused ATPase/permease subunit